jgi:hypothetical protein
MQTFALSTYATQKMSFIFFLFFKKHRNTKCLKLLLSTLDSVFFHLKTQKKTLIVKYNFI